MTEDRAEYGMVVRGGMLPSVPTIGNVPGIVSHDPAAVAAAEAAKARIQCAYIMALQRPRNTMEARDKILTACKRPKFAERAKYSKPVGGQSVVGPSIRFAEEALRSWGNILSDIQVVYDDETLRRCKVIITDLETNASFTKEITVSKTIERHNAAGRQVVGQRQNTDGKTVYIVKCTDDELHNKEANMISKALRNEGLRLIPSDIIDEALEVADHTMRSADKGDPDAAKKKVLDAFSSIGVKPKDLEAYLGHSVDRIVPGELADLRAVHQAIATGDAKWEDYVTVGEDGETMTHSAADVARAKAASMGVDLDGIHDDAPAKVINERIKAHMDKTDSDPQPPEPTKTKPRPKSDTEIATEAKRRKDERDVEKSETAKTTPEDDGGEEPFGDEDGDQQAEEYADLLESAQALESKLTGGQKKRIRAAAGIPMTDLIEFATNDKLRAFVSLATAELDKTGKPAI